jgi:hypothetical protein
VIDASGEDVWCPRCGTVTTGGSVWLVRCDDGLWREGAGEQGRALRAAIRQNRELDRRERLAAQEQ